MTAETLIYLDDQATTRTDVRVAAAMRPYFEDWFGNPHSLSHASGLRARKAVDTARQQIAAAIQGHPEDIIFTSGATESNNLALLGLQSYLASSGKTHVITQVTEHASVLGCLRFLERQGFSVTYLPVAKTGLVDPDELESAVKESTGLVSIMAVNNEIGTIQPIGEIGRRLRKTGILFHTDAAQAAGRIALAVENTGIDLLSLSGHKIYGPKGIGALYAGPRARPHLTPIIHGGGQQDGLRSGTLPTPLCVGLGEATALAHIERDKDWRHARHLQTLFIDSLKQQGLTFTINGSMEARIPHNLNISFPRIRNEDLIEMLPSLCLSSGSACSTGKTQISPVMQALGVKQDVQEGAVRFSYGRATDNKDIILAATAIATAIHSLS